MEVFCINDTGWIHEYSKLFGLIKGQIDSKGPSYGDINEVVGDEYGDGIKYYVLKEWPNQSYQSTSFIPIISNIDEKELSTNKEIYQTI
jgi:hypothetical protein